MAPRRPAAPPEDEPGDPGDPESVARTICLRLLTQRARTRCELATALSSRGVPDEAAGPVLSRFAEVGLIDDARFAKSFAFSQHRERGLSRRVVAVKLRQRGIDEQTVQAVVDQIDPDSEVDAAVRLAQRKLRSLGTVDQEVRRRRVYGLLLRRGYSPDLAMRVMRQTVGDGRGYPARGDGRAESDT